MLTVDSWLGRLLATRYVLPVLNDVMFFLHNWPYDASSVFLNGEKIAKQLKLLHHYSKQIFAQQSRPSTDGGLVRRAKFAVYDCVVGYMAARSECAVRGHRQRTCRSCCSSARLHDAFTRQ